MLGVTQEHLSISQTSLPAFKGGVSRGTGTAC